MPSEEIIYLISSEPSVLNGVVYLLLNQLTRLHDPATFRVAQLEVIPRRRTLVIPRTVW